MNLTKGVVIIAQERQRQIEKEGWTAEHDDQSQNDGDLALAGASYILNYASRLRNHSDSLNNHLANWVNITWQWAWKWWKPTPDDPVRQLAKAGALITAEIDRILRLRELNNS